MSFYISSIIGGAYGFVRMSLGPYIGFMVGACEVIGNTVYTTTSVVPLGQMISTLSGTADQWQPFYWLIFFASALALHFNNGRIYWMVNSILGAVALVILLLFIFISMPQANFPKYASTSDKPTGSFMSILPLTTWLYIGSEMIPFAGSDCNNVSRFCVNKCFR